MKIELKTIHNTVIVKSKTNRKTCPCCNGSLNIDTDEGKHSCTTCGETSGDYLTALYVSLTSSEGNLYFFEKYFSKDDFVKLELIKTIEDLRDAHYESIDNNSSQIEGKTQRENLIVRKAREG